MYKEFLWGGLGVGAWENRRREGYGIREWKEWVREVLTEWEFFAMLLVHNSFPIILVHGSLFSLIEPFSIFSTWYQTIFLRQISILDHHTRWDLHNSQSDPPQIRPPYPSTALGYPQTRQPNQTIRSDRHHHSRPPDQIIPKDHHPWLLSFKSAQNNQSLGTG